MTFKVTGRTMVWDALAKKSELLVVDARNITDPPVARIIMSQRVPYGFHANWVSEAQMATR